jgi:uncharacterized membrane protein
MMRPANHAEVRHQPIESEHAAESWDDAEDRLDVPITQWPPAVRLVAGAIGGALLANAVRRRTPLSVGLGLAGLNLLARAAANVSLLRIITAAVGLVTVEVEQHVVVQAPVREVFEFWINYHNFPTFMSHVLEVRDVGYDQSHWKVRGLAGVPVEWDAVLTELTEHEVLAWKTVPDSAVQHAGVVRFTPLGPRLTHVRVRLSYDPAFGAMGHAIAALFHSDPRRQLGDDLAHVKALLESRTGSTSTGVTTDAAHAPPRATSTPG